LQREAATVLAQVDVLFVAGARSGSRTSLMPCLPTFHMILYAIYSAICYKQRHNANVSFGVIGNRFTAHGMHVCASKMLLQSPQLQAALKKRIKAQMMSSGRSLSHDYNSVRLCNSRLLPTMSRYGKKQSPVEGMNFSKRIGSHSSLIECYILHLHVHSGCSQSVVTEVLLSGCCSCGGLEGVSHHASTPFEIDLRRWK
jgi:hypothetical protein